MKLISIYIILISKLGKLVQTVILIINFKNIKHIYLSKHCNKFEILNLLNLAVDGSKESQWNLVETSRESYISSSYLEISLIDLKLSGLSDDIQQSNNQNVIQFFQKLISKTDLKAVPLKPLSVSVYDKENDLVSKKNSYAHTSSPAECFECKRLLTKLEHDIGNDRSKVKLIPLRNHRLINNKLHYVFFLRHIL